VFHPTDTIGSSSLSSILPHVVSSPSTPSPASYQAQDSASRWTSLVSMSNSRRSTMMHTFQNIKPPEIPFWKVFSLPNFDSLADTLKLHRLAAVLCCLPSRAPYGVTTPLLSLGVMLSSCHAPLAQPQVPMLAAAHPGDQLILPCQPMFC
jgi:hypothetical protein